MQGTYLYTFWLRQELKESQSSFGPQVLFFALRFTYSILRESFLEHTDEAYKTCLVLKTAKYTLVEMFRESVRVQTACVLRSLPRCVELMARLTGIAAKLAVPGWRWPVRGNVLAVNKKMNYDIRPIREIKLNKTKHFRLQLINE